MATKPKKQEATLLRRFIEELYSRGVVSGEDGSQRPIFPDGVTPDRGAFIRDICISEGATRTLEIGMASGLSTLFILEALLENGAGIGAHLVIDPYESIEYHGAGRRNVRDASLEEFVEIKEEASELFLPELIRQKRNFDFAFIDGSHLFDNVFVDLVLVHQLLKPGGIVVFDDTFADAVYLTCRYAELNYGYTPVANHHSGDGLRPLPEGRRPTMRALRKPLTETRRGTFHFVPFFLELVRQEHDAAGVWHHNDLTAATGAPRPGANSATTSYSFNSSGHVFFVDANDHLHELWYDPTQGPGWNHNDLTSPTGLSPAAGTALTSYSLGSSGHVFFVDASNHLQELWYDPAQGPDWNHNDLTASTGIAPAAGTALTGYTLGSSGHVFFVDESNHLHEFRYDPAKGPGWNHSDLTASAKLGPAAGTALTSYTLAGSGHVVFIDTSNHLHELRYDPAKRPDWNHNDLTASTRLLPAIGTALTSYTLGSSGHVFFMDTSNHLHELRHDPADGPDWSHNDLTRSAELVPATGTALTSYTLGNSGHVFLVDTSDHLHELWYDPAQRPGQGWNRRDLTALAGPLAAARTALTSYTMGSSGHVLFIDDQLDLSELYL